MGRIWPDVPAKAEVHGVVNIDILEGKNGKPVLCLTAGGTPLYVTANIGEMIGGAARGATLRWDDFQEIRSAVKDGAGHDCDEWWTAAGVCALCDRVRQ